MRITVLFATISLSICGLARAGGTFIELQTPSMQITKISGNGEYAVGAISSAAGFRWTARTGAEELITELDAATGINNFGTIAGAVPENGGAGNGGRDLGAYAPVDAAPVLLDRTLQTNATGYDIADDGTVVGLSFEDGFAGAAVAFVWTPADGMTALPVNRPDTYSRANAISSDGRVIAGWNDQENGGRTAVVWQDRVPFDLVDADGNGIGEADGVSSNGLYVVGSDYFDADTLTSSAWIWSADGGVRPVPGMTFAFGVTNDGKTVIGSTGFFDDPPRAAMIWREGIGTMTAADFLAEQAITIPDGWDSGLSGGFTGISADGRLLGGWSFGPAGTQSYLIQLGADDGIFSDGFEAATSP